MPVELFGGVEFPVIGEAVYSLSLGPHGYYVFTLNVPRPIEVTRGTPSCERSIPSVRVRSSWEEVIRGGARPAFQAAVAGAPARPAGSAAGGRSRRWS